MPRARGLLVARLGGGGGGLLRVVAIVAALEVGTSVENCACGGGGGGAGEGERERTVDSEKEGVSALRPALSRAFDDEPELDGDGACASRSRLSS